MRLPKGGRIFAFRTRRFRQLLLRLSATRPSPIGWSTIDDTRRLKSVLLGAYEVLVRDRVKFGVASIVFIAFSHEGLNIPHAQVRRPSQQLGRRPT